MEREPVEDNTLSLAGAGGAGAEGTHANNNRRGSLRSVLRGMDLASGARLLTPVQQAGGQAREAVDADGPLGRAAALSAYKATRVLGWSPDWVRRLQTLVGVAPSGLASLQLAQAVATREVAAGREPTGRIDGKNLDWLVGLFPELREISRTVELGETTDANANARGVGCPEDTALKRAGVAQSYREYAQSVLQSTSFVGKSVVGHPDFLARLKAAESWLASKTGGLQGGALANRLGIHQVVSFRRNTAGADNLLHGIGFAIDINQSANNWNFGNGSRQTRFAAIMKSVRELLGVEVITGAAGLAAAGKEGTTEEMFEALTASNDSLKRFRALGQDRAALEAWLGSEACPAGAKRRSAADWQKTIAGFERTLKTRTAPAEDGAPPSGFMDFDSATIAGLRDGGGLRWGGTDFGEKFSGDMMHFDGNDMSRGGQIRDAVRDARRKAGEPYE